MISAMPEKAAQPWMGMKSCKTTSAASPTRGAARKTVFDAAAGMMVSLPQSLKKS